MFRGKLSSVPYILQEMRGIGFFLHCKNVLQHLLALLSASVLLCVWHSSLCKYKPDFYMLVSIQRQLSPCTADVLFSFR